MNRRDGRMEVEKGVKKVQERERGDRKARRSTDDKYRESK